MRSHALLAGYLIAAWFLAPAMAAVLAVGASTASGRTSLARDQHSSKTHLVGAEVLGTRYAPSGPQDTARYISPSPAAAYRDKAENGGCIVRFAGADPRRCAFGNARSHTRIFLVGDSHAMQWEPALRAAANSHGWRLVTYTKWGCPFNAREVALDRHPYTSCQQWNQRVMRAVIAAHPTLLLTSATAYKALGSNGRVLSSAGSKPYLVTGYKRWWRRLHSSHIPVTVIADTPRPNIDIDQCVAAHRNHLRRCAQDKARFAWQGGQALARATRQASFVHRVDFNDLLCPWRRCPAVLADVLLWRQNGHITATYSSTAKRQVGDRVEGVLRKVAHR